MKRFLIVASLLFTLGARAETPYDGDFQGYLSHALTGKNQAMKLTIFSFPVQGGTDVSQRFLIGGTVTLYLGDFDSNVYVATEFPSTELDISTPGLVLGVAEEPKNVEHILSVSEVTETEVKGQLFSKIAGEIGNFTLSRNRPSRPAGALVAVPSGTYFGPTGRELDVKLLSLGASPGDVISGNPASSIGVSATLRIVNNGYLSGTIFFENGVYDFYRDNIFLESNALVYQGKFSGGGIHVERAASSVFLARAQDGDVFVFGRSR